MALFGAFMRGALGEARPDREAIRRVKAWTRAALQASSDTTFAVNEIACVDPVCPGLETIILVMEPGVRTRACKVAKGLSDVTEQDVISSLAS